MGIKEIVNRTLSKTDEAKIHALAGTNGGDAIEDQMPGPIAEPSMSPAKPILKVDDIEFYGSRVMEFYEYFSNMASQSTAANLTLAAATLKASVVISGIIKDGQIKPTVMPPILAKLPYTGKKRGRKPKAK